MRRFGLVGSAALALAVLAGCQEDDSAPGDCPALCPGASIIVRDTIVLPVPGSDSSFIGYLPRASRTALFVSAGLPAGEYRSFVVFPKQRTDSIQVDGLARGFTVDTVLISLTLQARDSLATGLVVYLHRIPVSTDTTVTFAALEQLIAAGPIIDSIEVADSLRTGVITDTLTGPDLAKIAVPAVDSGRIGIGLTIRASKATGIRFGVDASSSTAAPQYQSLGKADIADTAKQRQTTFVKPADIGSFGYVGDRDLAGDGNPDLLYLGGPQGARTIIRFKIPQPILDSSQILRATLELTPAQPLNGVPNNPFGDSVAVRGVIADLGAKSPPLLTTGLQLSGAMAEGTENVVRVELFRLTTQWQIKGGPPTVVFLANGAESNGGGFLQPVFFSTRSPSGSPRIRLTYGLPTKPGKP